MFYSCKCVPAWGCRPSFQLPLPQGSLSLSVFGWQESIGSLKLLFVLLAKVFNLFFVAVHCLAFVSFNSGIPFKCSWITRLRFPLYRSPCWLLGYLTGAFVIRPMQYFFISWFIINHHSKHCNISIWFIYFCISWCSICACNKSKAFVSLPQRSYVQRQRWKKNVSHI